MNPIISCKVWEGPPGYFTYNYTATRPDCANNSSYDHKISGYLFGSVIRIKLVNPEHSFLLTNGILDIKFHSEDQMIHAYDPLAIVFHQKEPGCMYIRNNVNLIESIFLNLMLVMLPRKL